MHVLQNKHLKLKTEEVAELLADLKVSLAQLPKIKADDPGLPKDCKFGDVVKIERKDSEGRIGVYFRAVV